MFHLLWSATSLISLFRFGCLWRFWWLKVYDSGPNLLRCCFEHLFKPSFCTSTRQTLPLVFPSHQPFFRWSDSFVQQSHQQAACLHFGNGCVGPWAFLRDPLFFSASAKWSFLVPLVYFQVLRPHTPWTFWIGCTNHPALLWTRYSRHMCVSTWTQIFSGGQHYLIFKALSLS